MHNKIARSFNFRGEPAISQQMNGIILRVAHMGFQVCVKIYRSHIQAKLEVVVARRSNHSRNCIGVTTSGRECNAWSHGSAGGRCRVQTLAHRAAQPVETSCDLRRWSSEENISQGAEREACSHARRFPSSSAHFMSPRLIGTESLGGHMYSQTDERKFIRTDFVSKVTRTYGSLDSENLGYAERKIQLDTL